jgi:hypothetical protein
MVEATTGTRSRAVRNQTEVDYDYSLVKAYMKEGKHGREIGSRLVMRSLAFMPAHVCCLRNIFSKPCNMRCRAHKILKIVSVRMKV